MNTLKTVILVVTLFIIGCSPKKEPVDLLVTNAKIYTVNDAFEIVEAIAIKDGKIIATGKNKRNKRKI